VRTVPAVLVAALLVAGCDDTFEPIATGAAHLSVFGYLDASADTQWIRIMPIRPLIITTPDTFPATVTLENLATRHVVQLRDSLFHFSSHLHPELGSEGIYLHNFWTTERIEKGATYRLRIERPDHPVAEATIVIPAAYETEVWYTQVTGVGSYLRLDPVAHLPFVSSVLHFEDRCGTGIAYRPHRLQRSDGETHMIPLGADTVPARDACGRMTVRKRKLLVVASGAPWPAGSVFSPLGLGVPEAPSNITNAVGFIGGVITRLVPFEDCAFARGGVPVPNHCVVRYNDAAASVRGRVNEVRCGEGALDSASVVLTEVDTQPRSHRKIRTTLTNKSGEYEIEGLESGVRYEFHVHAKPEPEPFTGLVNYHSMVTDTIQFGVGERRTRDITLERIVICR
jgi:hypothetical protein